MKYLFLLLFTFSFTFAFAQRNCLQPQKTNERLENNPQAIEHHREVMNFIQNPENNDNLLSKNPNTVVTVPVVVHVLYKNSTQNISDAQVLSQINVLNADYRKLNTDFSTVVPSAFQSYGADMELVFCMATKTPTGAATTGIVRKSVSSSFSFGDNYYTSTGDPAWDPTKYLNIWIGKFEGSYADYLGFAYLPDAAGQAFDGLCIDYRYYGTMGTAVSPYNKGRTATHEIGHYFGLLHPWGEDYSACGTAANSDGVADTPATNDAYFNCPTFPDNTNACTPTANGSMFMNYMDYVDDACMAFFTNGQKTILQNTITTYRSGLINSAVTNCSTMAVEDYELQSSIKVYPNPIKTGFYISSPLSAIDEVEIYNLNGMLIKSIKTSVNQRIDVNDLSTGTYFIRIYNENKFLKSDKFVKE